MRFLGRCLLFASVLLSPAAVGVLSQSTPAVDLACVGIKTQAEASIATFTGLSTATVNPAASATLPASLQTCITNDSNTGKVLRVIFAVYKANGANYPSSTDVWTAAGWPANVRIPTNIEYGQFAALAATLSAGLPTITVGGGSTGGNANFDPTLIPACAGKSLQDCLALCVSNPLACVPTGATGGNGGVPPPPPFIPPNLNDLLKQYQQALGQIGTCQTACPNNLLCIGQICAPPQPRCDQQCGPEQFCKPKLDAAAIAQFNANATAGAYAGAGAGGAQAGAQGSITVNGNAQVMPGGVVSGTCVSIAPVCNATSCPTGQVCAPFDGCKPCAACGNIPGLDLGNLLQGGFDPSSLTGNVTLPPGQNPGQGQQIPPGTIGQIQGGSSQYGQVVFGASASGQAAGGAAVTAVAGGARANADQLLANIRDAALQLAADAQLAAKNIQVAANATLEVVLAAQNSQASASQSVNINGPLVIRGPGSPNQVDPNNPNFAPQGVFNFPPSASGNTVGAGGVVNAAGGVGLTGDLGSLTLSINAIASAAAAVAVPAGQWLRSSGQVLGQAAQVIVQGILELHNAGFQPAITVSASGNVTVAVGKKGNFSCGALAIQAGGKLDIWSNGSSTYFANLTRCDSSALIRIRVDSIASLKAAGGSGIAFGYGAVNATVKASLKCGAQLYDGTDSITLTNANTATGRRLLAAGDGSQIAFGDQSATYTVPTSSSSSTGTQGKNSVSAVTPATGLVMLLLTTLIATVA